MFHLLYSLGLYRLSFVVPRLPIGSRVELLKDSPYNGVVIPAGTHGTLIDDDNDRYFGQLVEFDGFSNAYFVERGLLKVVH